MAEPLRPIPESELLAELDRILYDLAPSVRAQFLAAVRRLQLPEAELRQILDVGPKAISRLIGALPASQQEIFKAEARALEEAGLNVAGSRRAAAVQASLPWQDMEAQLLKAYAEEGPIGKAAQRGANLGLRLIQGGAEGGGAGGRGPLSEATIREKAKAYVERAGAERVKDITDATRGGFREVLVGAFDESLTPEQTARQVRQILNTRQSNGFIGLDSRQSAAFQKRFAALQADPELSAKQIQLRADRLHGKMLRERADRQARTELSLAVNNGQKTAWAEVGKLNNTEIVGLEADFTAELDGEVISLPTAPLHPRCYCMARLVRVRSAEGVIYYAREWVTRVVGVCEKCQALDGKLALPAGFKRAA